MSLIISSSYIAFAANVESHTTDPFQYYKITFLQPCVGRGIILPKIFQQRSTNITGSGTYISFVPNAETQGKIPAFASNVSLPCPDVQGRIIFPKVVPDPPCFVLSCA